MADARIALQAHLDPERVIALDVESKQGALEALVTAAATSDAVTDPEALLSAVLEREELLSTGIGLGIAIPHAKIPSVKRFVVVVGRHAQGIDFGSIDGRPVRIAVLIAGPQDAQKDYLELLAQLSKRLKVEPIREEVIAATERQRVVDLLVGE